MNPTFAAASSPKFGKVIPTDRPTLLIVDDEIGPRTSIKIIFQDSYRILLAESGESALELLQDNQVDVAILDILMAGMTGTELLTKIKEHDPLVEVIMLTAYETLQTTREALRQGASDYLNKPFDISTLRAAVDNALKKRQLALARKSATDELLQIREELEAQILNEQMTRTQGEIYANILHDIHNPLSVVNLYMDVLSQSLKNPGNFEKHHEMLLKEMECIKTEVRHCFNISRRYLGYLRQRDEETHLASINETLLDLRKLLKTHPHLHENILSIELLQTDVLASIHSIDLLQILLNLTSNALQCTPQKHEVRICVKLSEEKLEQVVWKQNSQNRFITGMAPSASPPTVILQVKDNGPGITEKILDQLFDVQVTTKVTHQGTGLGLTIIKRLIQAAGAALHIHTELGVGTICTLYLP